MQVDELQEELRKGSEEVLATSANTGADQLEASIISLQADLMQETERRESTEQQLAASLVNLKTAQRALEDALLERDDAMQANLKSAAEMAGSEEQLAASQVNLKTVQSALDDALLERDAMQAKLESAAHMAGTEEQLAASLVNLKTVQRELKDALLELDESKQAKLESAAHRAAAEEQLAAALVKLSTVQSALDAALLERDAMQAKLESTAHREGTEEQLAAALVNLGTVRSELEAALLERDIMQENLESTAHDVTAARAELTDAYNQVCVCQIGVHTRIVQSVSRGMYRQVGSTTSYLASIREHATAFTPGMGFVLGAEFLFCKPFGAY